MRELFAVMAVLAACGQDEPLGPTDSFADPAMNLDDAGPPESVCTSDRRWTGGDNRSPQMHPGVACNECHIRPVDDGGTRIRGPRFAAAGTVYLTLHEPDDCYGVKANGEVEIEVTGADGQIVRARPNEVGNFFTGGSLTMPITARVLYQGRVSVMTTPVESADCNSCHTEHGTDGAPGRITLP